MLKLGHVVLIPSDYYYLQFDLKGHRADYFSENYCLRRSPRKRNRMRIVNFEEPEEGAQKSVPVTEKRSAAKFI